MLVLIRLLEEEQDYNPMITAPKKKKRISLVYEKNGGAEGGGNKVDDIPSIFFAYGTLVDSV